MTFIHSNLFDFTLCWLTFQMSMNRKRETVASIRLHHIKMQAWIIVISCHRLHRHHMCIQYRQISINADCFQMKKKCSHKLFSKSLTLRHTRTDFDYGSFESSLKINSMKQRGHTHAHTHTDGTAFMT